MFITRTPNPTPQNHAGSKKEIETVWERDPLYFLERGKHGKLRHFIIHNEPQVM